jgi:putative hemolysin
VSIESWIDSSVLILAFLLLAVAGLVEASLNKRQRLTIREILDSGTNGGQADHGTDQSAEMRAATDIAMLLSVLAIGAAATHVTLRMLSLPWLFAVIPGVLVLLLIVGRLMPAILVDRFDLADSSGIERIAVLLSVLMGPLLVVLQTTRFSFDRQSHAPEPANGAGSNVSEDNRDDDAGSKSSEVHELDIDEHEMISGILSLEEAFAREIMVPRPDMVAVAMDMPIPDVVRVAEEAGHSRIPVYDESVDNIRGIVYAKDLLRFVHQDLSGVSLTDLMRPALFVPESKRVDDLLRDLQRARVHLAVVVDEYGGTAGLVTIEDIIEEIVGEIQDEYDREVPLFERRDEGEFTVDGRMSVDELSELLGVRLPETESETVGGLVARALGHIPESGDVGHIGAVTFRVEAVERRRVRSIQVWLGEGIEEADSSDPVRAN